MATDTDLSERGPAASARNRRIRVIFNPNAGPSVPVGGQRATSDDLEAILSAAGVVADVVESQSEDDARAAAAEAAKNGFEAVVAAGGDGTIGLVAHELIGSGTALGVLPLGSIMNVPRMLGIPRDLAAAAQIIAAGVTRRIDVGEVRGRPFFESGSVGLNAAVFREAQRVRGGEGGSVARTIWLAIRYRPARMRIELDNGVIQTRALTVTVSNGPYTGAAMTVAPDARLDDGKLDVRVFERFSKLELIRHFAAIAFGRREYVPRISTFRSTFAKISSAHPLPARADSRDLGTTPLEFRVRPGALSVIVPPDGLPGTEP